MADDSTSAVRKKYTRPHDDPLNPPDRSEINKEVSEKQKKLWEALYEYITQQGGWVTSVPGLKHLRLEVPPGSALPAKLREFGYSVHHAGTGTRLSPGNTPEKIFRAVDVVEITIPGK
jgi:hypothetical protein